MAKTNTTKTKPTKTEKGAKAAPPKEKKVAQAGAQVPTAEASEPNAPARPRVGPFKFLQQVRTEAIDKVTWPTWKETYVTSIMVFVMVILAALFFLLIDEVLGNAVSYLLKLAS